MNKQTFYKVQSTLDFYIHQSKGDLCEVLGKKSVKKFPRFSMEFL